MDKIIIKKPIVSEKSISEGVQSKYTFVVDKGATKQEVGKAVQALFKVHVESVNIVNVKGKMKTFRRIRSRRAGYKKAVITLKKGERIALFEEKEEKK